MNLIRSLMMGAALVGAVALAAKPASADGAPEAHKHYAPAIATYNWSGVYAGVGIGQAWATLDDSWTQQDNFFRSGTKADLNPTAWFGSGRVGVQHQINSFVGGIELSWNQYGHGMWDQSISGTNPPCSFTGPNGGTPCGVENRVRWSAQLTPKLGFAMDHWLGFVKAGWAWTRTDVLEVNCCNNGANPFSNPWDSSASAKLYNGWVIGVGGEYAFTKSIILGLEYQHITMNDATHASGLMCDKSTPCGFGPPRFGRTSVGGDIDTVQATLAFKFGRPEAAPLK